MSPYANSGLTAQERIEIAAHIMREGIEEAIARKQQLATQQEETPDELQLVGVEIRTNLIREGTEP